MSGNYGQYMPYLQFDAPLTNSEISLANLMSDSLWMYIICPAS